ncbi:MAG TPA: hypothetical protein VM600_08495 [Actinomycetota bacterium]|nr:hypothetical protein [Actinomycetota bacterium]
MTQKTEPRADAPRFTESMPRPVFVLFALLAIAAVGASLAVIIQPFKRDVIAVEDRRPPSSDTHTHDVGRIFPAPVPSDQQTLPPPCEAVARTRILGYGGAVGRVTRALRDACTLDGPGVDPRIPTAISGLEGATIRFADFERTGVESTVERSTKTIWLNVKLANAKIPDVQIVPVILHEAWHLAHSARITASQELDARGVEAAVCAELVPIDDHRRWCKDARALVALPREDALRRLTAAGYPEG